MNDPKVYDALDGKWNRVGMRYSSDDYFSILNLHWKINDESPSEECTDILDRLVRMMRALHTIDFFHDGEEHCEVR